MQPGDNLVVTSADHHQHVAVKLGVVLQWMQQALEVSGTIQCSSSKQDLMLSLVCLVNFSFTQKSLCPLMDCSTWRSAQQETGQISRRWGSASGDVKGHKRRGDSVLSTCASQKKGESWHFYGLFLYCSCVWLVTWGHWRTLTTGGCNKCSKRFVSAISTSDKL